MQKRTIWKNKKRTQGRDKELPIHREVKRRFFTRLTGQVQDKWSFKFDHLRGIGYVVVCKTSRVASKNRLMQNPQWR